jgi:hypothetical protein
MIICLRIVWMIWMDDMLSIPKTPQTGPAVCEEVAALNTYPPQENGYRSLFTVRVRVLVIGVVCTFCHWRLISYSTSLHVNLRSPSLPPSNTLSGLLKALLEGELKGDDSPVEDRLARIQRTMSLYGRQLFDVASSATLAKWAEALQEMAQDIEARHAVVQNGPVLSANVLSILCESLTHFHLADCRGIFPSVSEKVVHACKRATKAVKLNPSGRSVWIVWSHSIRSCNALLHIAAKLQNQNLLDGQRDDVFSIVQPLVSWMVGLFLLDKSASMVASHANDTTLVPLLLPCLSNAIKLFPQRMKSYAAKIDRGCRVLLVSSSVSPDVRRLAACVLASLPACTGDPNQWKSSLCNALAEAVKLLDRVRGKEQTTSVFSQAFIAHGLNLDLDQALCRKDSASPCPSLVCDVFSSLVDYAVLLLESSFPDAAVHIPLADMLVFCEEVLAVSHTIAGRKSIVAPNESALAPASIVTIQPTLHMGALRLLKAAIQAQGRTGCLKNLAKISALMMTFLKIHKSRVHAAPTMVRVSSCNVVASVFLVMGAGALNLANDCIPVFLNYFGGRKRDTQSGNGQNVAEQPIGKLPKGKKRKRNVQPSAVPKADDSAHYHFANGGEEIAVATAFVSMVNQAFVCCGGLINSKNRCLVEGVLLDLIANFDDLGDANVGKVAFLGELMELMSTCMILPYPGGSQSPILGRALLFFTAMRSSGCQALSLRAYKGVAVAEALLHPRAPPLQHPAVLLNEESHRMENRFDSSDEIIADRSSLLVEEEAAWENERARKEVVRNEPTQVREKEDLPTGAPEAASKDIEMESSSEKELSSVPSLQESSTILPSSNVVSQNKTDAVMGIALMGDGAIATGGDSVVVGKNLRDPVPPIAVADGGDTHSQSGSESDVEDFPEIVDGEPSDDSGEE